MCWCAGGGQHTICCCPPLLLDQAATSAASFSPLACSALSACRWCRRSCRRTCSRASCRSSRCGDRRAKLCCCAAYAAVQQCMCLGYVAAAGMHACACLQAILHQCTVSLAYMPPTACLLARPTPTTRVNLLTSLPAALRPPRAQQAEAMLAQKVGEILAALWKVGGPLVRKCGTNQGGRGSCNLFALRHTLSTQLHPSAASSMSFSLCIHCRSTCWTLRRRWAPWWMPCCR